jgi:hypothetical protein
MPKPTEADKDRFRSLVPDDPRVEVKPMFGNLGAFVNGNMFVGARLVVTWATSTAPTSHPAPAPSRSSSHPTAPTRSSSSPTAASILASGATTASAGSTGSNASASRPPAATPAPTPHPPAPSDDDPS